MHYSIRGRQILLHCPFKKRRIFMIVYNMGQIWSQISLFGLLCTVSCVLNQFGGQVRQVRQVRKKGKVGREGLTCPHGISCDCYLLARFVTGFYVKDCICENHRRNYMGSIKLVTLQHLKKCDSYLCIVLAPQLYLFMEQRYIFAIIFQHNRQDQYKNQTFSKLPQQKLVIFVHGIAVYICKNILA